MSWVTKKIYDFLMDLIGDVIGTFSDLIMDLYSGRVSEIVSSSQVLGAVMVTTGIATTLVSFMVIKQLFCIYILETEGDAEADPLQQLVKATVAIALIQTNSVVLSALLRYAALFGTEVLAGSGMVRDNLSSEHLMEALSNTGISLIVAAIFLVIFAAGAIGNKFNESSLRRSRFNDCILDTNNFSRAILDATEIYPDCNVEPNQKGIDTVQYTMGGAREDEVASYKARTEWKMSGEKAEVRMDIREDIAKSGFCPTKSLISNMEKLDAITGEHHKLKDVVKLYRENHFQNNHELSQTVLDIAEECKQQELSRMAEAIIPE